MKDIDGGLNKNGPLKTIGSGAISSLAGGSVIQSLPAAF